MNNFSHLFVVNLNQCLKRPNIKRKRSVWEMPIIRHFKYILKTINFGGGNLIETHQRLLHLTWWDWTVFDARLTHIVQESFDPARGMRRKEEGNKRRHWMWLLAKPWCHRTDEMEVGYISSLTDGSQVWILPLVAF